MSKQALLTVANFNLFNNVNPEIEFSVAKDQRVQAAYSGYDKAKGYDVRGIKAKSGTNVGYIRLSISTMENGQREYHNGALFVNDRKQSANQPDFQGSVNLDNKSDGPKLRLSAWKKNGAKSGDYLSIAIQEFMNSNPGSSPAANPPTSGGFDMNDDTPPQATRTQAPQANRVPARQAAPAPAPASQYADDDFDVPF